MAKSWCGFLPQNQNVIEQWGYMEATSHEILEALRFVRQSAGADGEEDGDEPPEDLFVRPK